MSRRDIIPPSGKCESGFFQLHTYRLLNYRSHTSWPYSFRPPTPPYTNTDPYTAVDGFSDPRLFKRRTRTGKKEGVRCRYAPCVLRSLGHRRSGLQPSPPVPRPTPDGYSAALHSRACRPDDPLRRSSLRRISGYYALRRHPCRDHKPYHPISLGFPDTTQTSRGKTGRLRCTTTESNALALHGRELRGHMPARPAGQASYPVPVHRIAALLHAYFRRCVATRPFASLSIRRHRAG